MIRRPATRLVSEPLRRHLTQTLSPQSHSPPICLPKTQAHPHIVDRPVKQAPTSDRITRVISDQADMTARDIAGTRNIAMTALNSDHHPIGLDFRDQTAVPGPTNSPHSVTSATTGPMDRHA